jgi:hypothetical protein
MTMKKTQPILIAVSATEQAGSLEVSSQAAIATDNLASGNVVADNSRERGTNARTEASLCPHPAEQDNTDTAGAWRS